MKKLPKNYRLRTVESNLDPILVTWDYTMLLEKWTPKKFLRRAKWKIVARQRIGWLVTPAREKSTKRDLVQLAYSMEAAHD